MSIRRLQYNIDYIHILTFKEEYKSLVIPYFGFKGLRYAIDNENTIHESIRLVFPIECLALNIRKEGITFIYEGEVEQAKKTNGVLKIYWDLFEKIKSLNGFKKTTRHTIISHDVEILEPEKVETLMQNNKFLKINPFGKLDEFACAYEYSKDNLNIKFEFGNYSSKDITKHDLSPFKTDFNNDLIDGVGLITRIEIKEDTIAPTFSKFKSLLSKTESIISSYNN